jgi:tetratricopeptide (TPR) repeat protein
MSLRELTVLVQDRLLYVPAFGWSLALGIVAVRLADASPHARNAVAGAFAVWLLACTLAVVRLERYWHDDVTYFSRCVAIAPHNAEYLRQLVDKLNDRGYLTAAMERLRNAIKLEPDNYKLHQKLADQYALMQRGDDFREESLKVHALATKERALGNQAR